MSASSKKKLHSEQEAAKLTERQLAEQKEAKKLKLYTAAFAAVMVVILAIAITVGVTQFINTSGIREKNTVAVTLDGHQLSNAELNYFYIDTLNQFYSQNGSYASLFGLDVTLPLNEQYMDEESGETWADYFLDSAVGSAQSVYGLWDAAQAEGFVLSSEDQATVDSAVNNMALYASLYGYADTEAYIKAMYGNGATEESYRNYVEMSLTADAFQTAYADSLVYEDADLRAAEADNFHKYSSFAYSYYYVSTSNFLENSSEASAEEKAAAAAQAKEAAESLVSEEINTPEALDAAIAALPMNAENINAVATRYTAQAYTSISAPIAEWLSDSSRKEGDSTAIANTSTDAEGNETVSGYYVVLFQGVNDNAFALKNVRHILVGFEGGTADEYGNTVYSDEEKAAAKTAAEEILAEYEAAPSESAFSTLATLRSTDTGSTANGGLYEDVYPNQMVAPFEEWCYAEGRKTGDTGIVETEYGYHVMYFVGDSETTYRDYQIENDLRSAAISEWYTGIVNNVTVTDGDAQYLALDMVLSR